MNFNFRIAVVGVFFAVAQIGFAPRAWSAPKAPHLPQSVDVVIVGAGLSGLNAAYELKKAGMSYRILEITPHIGGRVRTVKYKLGGEELMADSGMEEYWESNPAVKVLQELKLPLRSDIGLSSLVLQKKLEPLGEEEGTEYLKRILGNDGYQAFSQFKLKYEPLVHELKPGAKVSAENLKLKDISFAQFILDQKMPEKVSEWIRISLECEIATEWTRISALDGLAEFHIFIGNKDNGEKCYRVEGGNEKFSDAFANHIGKANISLNTRVNRIVSRPGHGVSVYYLDQTSNTSGLIQGRYVICTIPLFRLFEVQFEPALSDKKREAISSQGWGAYFKAHVFLPPTADQYWTRKGSSFLPLLSDSNLGVIYDGNPDQKGKTKILSLLIHGSFAEAYNMMTLDQVRAQISESLDKLFPGMSKEIRGMELYRFHPKAVAAWPPGRSRFDGLSDEMRKPENNVIFAGDFTESSHSDGAFASSSRAVRDILELRKASK